MDAFYKQVIAILQKQGLVAEAMAVAKEWNAEKSQAAKEQLGIDELQRKKARDLGLADVAWARVDALTAKGLDRKAASTVGKILQDMESETDPARRAMLQKAAENASAGKIIVQDLGDKVQLLDATTRQVIRTDDKNLNPRDQQKDDEKKQAAANAYDQYMLGLQRQYDAAVDLYNHPGVEGITGRFGRFVGATGVAGGVASTLSSDAAGAAFALYEQVTGGTFLSGLAQLKAASKTGASGLGAVSEREGDKVQAEGAALNRLQQPKDFRTQLSLYVHRIMAFASQLAAAAKGDGIEPKPLATKALTGPVRGGRAVSPPVAAQPAAAASAAPAVAPAAPAPAAGKPPEEWVRVNGKLQRKQ
jgi:hypothetical protein